MNSKDFMKELIEQGRKFGDKPISRTIGKVKFEFGYSGFASGHSMTSLFRPITEPGKAQEVETAMRAHTKSLGGNGSAIFGLRYTAPAEYCLSFDAQYGKERFVKAETEETDFNEISKAINELGIALNEWVWCAYKSIESPSAIEKGDAGKYEIKTGEKKGEMTYPKIIVPIELFPNEQAARAATGGGSTAKDNSQWSDTARANYSDILTLADQATEISEWYGKMIGGTAFNNDPENFPLPVPTTPPAVKKQLAELYQCSSADIDILMSQDVAF